MKLNHAFLLLCLLCLSAACNKEPKIDVTGSIVHAKGKTLYFEQFGLNKVDVLDSAKLDLDGRFHFKTTLPGAPEFYRLRIENRFIHLAADSSVKITVKADADDFGQNYKVDGSKICEYIRILSEWQDKTLSKMNDLSQRYSKKELTSSEYETQIKALFEKQKSIARKIILDNPLSPAAYFALFQRVHNYLVFDTFNPDDNLCYKVVASSWEALYPDATRTKHLKLIALQGIKVIQEAKKQNKLPVIKEADPSYFEIALPDIFGKERKLSELRGKIVLLDFTMLSGSFSPDRNLRLREVYNRFSKKGFEIYQISYDEDEQFWKNAARNLPWISVRDKNLNQSEYLRLYNIQSVPTYFLINKQGEIYKRDAMVKDLQKELNTLL